MVSVLRGVRALRTLALIGVGATTACVGTARGTARTLDVAENGLPRVDESLRRALVAGAFGDVLARSSSVKLGAPTDPLLRALYRGSAAYYAGNYAESGQALQLADRLAEDRYTQRVSKYAAAVIGNDLSLPYVPGRTERLFVHYYTMLGAFQAGDRETARASALRLGAALQFAAPDVQTNEREVHAVLREATGAVFEAVGDENDALVAYRNAALLRGADRREVDAITLRPRAGDSATVVVFVESGFVAHRVEQPLSWGYVDDGSSSRRQRRAARATPTDRMWRRTPNGALDEGEPELRVALPPRAVSGEDGRGFPIAAPPDLLPHAPPTAVPGVTPMDVPAGPQDTAAPREPPPVTRASIADHLALQLDAAPERGLFRSDRVVSGRDWWRWGDTGANRWLRIAWPVLARSPLSSAPLRFRARRDDVLRSTVADAAIDGPLADVSLAVAEDLRRARPAMIARATARIASRVAVSELAAEKSAWLGTAVSLLGAAVDRADTRSWQLLPGAVRMLRLTVPIARDSAPAWIAPTLEVGSDLAMVPVRLAPTRIAAGQIQVLAARVWRDASDLVAPAIANEKLTAKH
jgi:hypothetical protein